MPLNLERLSRAHRPLLKTFDCGVPVLNSYLHQWALRHQNRDFLSRTWLAIDQDHLAGFFTLTTGSLDRAAAPTPGSLDSLPGFPIPAILLARLAVDQNAQGQGVGKWLFDMALQQIVALLSNGPIGFRVLITDAKDERAQTFYLRQGMESSPGCDWPRRMVLDLKYLQPPSIDPSNE
jgi:GNAT superfamily N-acetyltransferase